MPATDATSWFDAAPASQRPALDALRKLVLAATPGVVEEIKWGRPCYSTAHGLFCYLHRTKNHVTLGFYHGAALKDPTSVLEGDGKDMRHVKVTGIAVDRGTLLPLVKQAAQSA